MKLAVHYMRKNASERKGLIVCTASNAGIYPFPIAPIYGTTKHGVVGMVRSLANSLQPEGIRINAICPNVIGMFPTLFSLFNSKCSDENTATGLADENLFSHMMLTPMSVAIDAVRELVTNTSMAGVTAEVSGEKFTIREPPEFVDDFARQNFQSFLNLGYA